jgi:hypothetical protein
MKLSPKHILIIPLLFTAPMLSAQVVFSQSVDDIYVVNDGSYNSGTGVFTYSGTDSRQGILASFDAWNLTVGGKAIEATFSILGGSVGTSERNQALVLGLFSGPTVTSNGQTSASNDWEGYFHAIGARSSSGETRWGTYRQGDGTQPLMDRTNNWISAKANVDGQGTQVTNNLRPPYDMTSTTDFTVRLERVSATELLFTTIYATPRTPTTAPEETRSVDGLSVTLDVTDGIATIATTHLISQGGPTSINGIAIMGLGDFTLTDLTVVPEPSTYAIWAGMLALGIVALRRRLR